MKPIFITLGLSAALLLSGCQELTEPGGDSGTTAAVWAYEFVKWNDEVYVMTDEVVSEVGEELGEVTMYSDAEGSYDGNFSNSYEEGTKYFAITGVSPEEAIAVREDGGTYRKAIIEDAYEIE
ncbi:hypothetical protein [Planococcus lenghuensis]|uniref:Uncharacterized protein n=1 Tax=Planococcus lenghuensis TaxID=2213202 RepID=A0A1Q2KZQ4_9BACL|nr:hypothetical protein [Planococcus lenghuensis]AQQ53122.1 hypothetical protein B0X71_08455 [Planococcus lenghuensis]